MKYNGGDSGIKISVLYWRCSLIRVSVIRGFTVIYLISVHLQFLKLITDSHLVLTEIEGFRRGCLLLQNFLGFYTAVLTVDLRANPVCRDFVYDAVHS